MSEQYENTERRIREALHAEASEAPVSQDLWARVEPRLERPDARALGWLRGWRLAVGGATAAVILTLGGAGAALIAADQFSGGEDGALRTDRQWSGVDGESLESITVNDTDVDLYDIDGKQSASADSPGEFLAYDPGTTWASTEGPVPSPSLDKPKSDLTTDQPSSWDTQVSADKRQVISQASIDLEVSDVNAASTQLRGLVQSLGGFVEHISTSGGPNPEYGSAVVRVPSERFPDAIDGIERLGKSLGQTLGQRDVTGEAIDLEARLRSERSTEESLLKLLDRAVSVSDVLTVERELSRVRANIERLQGQLDYLQRSVALATITVSFVLPPGSVPVAPSATLQLEVEDVERSAGRVQQLGGQREWHHGSCHHHDSTGQPGSVSSASRCPHRLSMPPSRP